MFFTKAMLCSHPTAHNHVEITSEKVWDHDEVTIETHIVPSLLVALFKKVLCKRRHPDMSSKMSIIILKKILLRKKIQLSACERDFSCCLNIVKDLAVRIGLG